MKSGRHYRGHMHEVVQMGDLPSAHRRDDREQDEILTLLETIHSDSVESATNLPTGH